MTVFAHDRHYFFLDDSVMNGERLGWGWTNDVRLVRMSDGSRAVSKTGRGAYPDRPAGVTPRLLAENEGGMYIEEYVDAPTLPLTGRVSREHLVAVAGALRRFHRPLPCGTATRYPVDVARWVAGAPAWVRSAAEPALDIVASDPVTCHGDLHRENVLVRDGSAVLIDFDLAGPGPPELDLANFLQRCAYEHCEGVHRLDPGLLPSGDDARAFLAAYGGDVGVLSRKVRSVWPRVLAMWVAWGWAHGYEDYARECAATELPCPV